MKNMLVFLLALITAPDVFAVSIAKQGAIQGSKNDSLAASQAAAKARRKRILRAALKRQRQALAEPGACEICHAEYAEPEDKLCADCLDCQRSRTGSKARKLPPYKRDDGSGSGVAAPSEEGGEVLPMPAPTGALPVGAAAAPSAHSLVAAAAPGRCDIAKTGTILRCPHACPFTTELAYNLTTHLECHDTERLDANPGYLMCTKPGCGFITARCRMAPHEKLPHPPAAQ